MIRCHTRRSVADEQQNHCADLFLVRHRLQNGRNAADGAGQHPQTGADVRAQPQPVAHEVRVVAQRLLHIDVHWPCADAVVELLAAAEQAKVDGAGGIFHFVRTNLRLDPVVGQEAGQQQTDHRTVDNKCDEHKAARLDAHVVFESCTPELVRLSFLGRARDCYGKKIYVQHK